MACGFQPMAETRLQIGGPVYSIHFSSNARYRNFTRGIGGGTAALNMSFIVQNPCQFRQRRTCKILRSSVIITDLPGNDMNDVQQRRARHRLAKA